MERRREGRGEHKRKRGEEWYTPLFYPIFSLSMDNDNRSGGMGRAGRITVNLSLINLSHNKGWGRRGKGLERG